MGKGQIPVHAFTGKGIGLKFGENPVAVRFPADIKAILESMGGPEKQDFVRAAVMEKLERDSLLPIPEVAIEPETEDQDYADRNFADSDLSPAQRMEAYRFSLGEPIKDDPLR